MANFYNIEYQSGLKKMASILCWATFRSLMTSQLLRQFLFKYVVLLFDLPPFLECAYLFILFGDVFREHEKIVQFSTNGIVETIIIIYYYYINSKAQKVDVVYEKLLDVCIFLLLYFLYCTNEG